MTWQPKKLQRR
uniref:Uncharacterized protein n=1 Tax=Anguilla anguilla TaxID=7936 RepID=A0A0E9VMC3_ANGAN